MKPEHQLSMFEPMGLQLSSIATRSMMLSSSHRATAFRHHQAGMLASSLINYQLADRLENDAFTAEMALQFEQLAELQS